MTFRSTRFAPGFGFETLERRQFLAAQPRLAEVESNNSMPSAMPVDLRTDPSAVVSGVANRLNDRDFFRVKVAANSRLQITISNRSEASVKLRVTDAFSVSLASTSKRASVYLDGGRSYFLKIQSKSDVAAAYELDLRSFTSEVPQTRLDRLKKGVNLPQWFWNISGNVQSTMDNAITQADVSLIKKLGFGHVRLPVDMQYFFDSANHFNLNSTYLDELDRAISLLESNGLGVIVSPFGDHQNWLVAGGDAREAAKAFSWTFAKHLSRFDPEYTYLQTTNEPPGGGGAWQPVQEQLIRTLRDAAPRHTIITATPLYYGATASTFGTTGAINELSTYRDTNIVYGLHFYEPFVFTHQGASWAIPGMQFINGLSFPANLSQTESLSASLRSQYTGTAYEPIVDLVRYYGIDGWGRAKVDARLALARSWASRNKVPMILDEFGVYGKSVDDASRFAYLTDVRMSAEAVGMGWTMWDYNSEFGVVTETSSGPKVRYDVIAALDLNTP